MNIDVGKAIAELLFEHETVIVPGLGGFTAEPESATVDYVQGVVTPPAKKIGFNPNLVINDGILVGHIQKRDLVTVQQAKEAVETYVAELNTALERREIIEIPTVGRIYRDYERKLKFMAEGTNFESNSFGLPEVKFTPVNRAKETPSEKTIAPKVGKVAAATQAAAAATAKSAGVKTATTEERSSSWLSKLLPFLIVVAALLLAFSIFMIFRGGTDDTAVADIQEERVNVPPATEKVGGEEATIPAEDGTTDATANTDGDGEMVDASSGEESTSSSEEGETTTSNTGSEDTDAMPSTGDFIVIHSFGVIGNARKFERKLKKDGYAARSVKYDGLHRVGVKIETGMERAEVEALISTLGKKYKSTPKRVDY